MATLPLYQPTGYLPADTPRLDFANLKEQANQLQTITASLDRVSNFAFKRAMEQAEREGLQYGAENQPSLEQVMAASERGESIQELFAKPGTVFGDAARKVQAGQLRNELEVLGRKKLSDLSALIDSGNFNLQDVQREITSMTAGYAKAVSSVSPEEGLKFRASMATVGNAVYTKAADQALKIQQEALKLLANDSLNTTEQLFTDTLASEADPKAIVLRYEHLRARDFQTVVNAGGSDVKYIQGQMAQFDIKVANSIIGYLSNPDVSKNQAEVFNKLQTGNVGKLSELYKKLDKNQIIAVYAKRVSQDKQIIDANRSVEKMQNEEAANGLLIEYFSPTTNQVRKRDIGNQLARLKVLSIDQMERFLNPNVGDGDPYAFADLKYRVATGDITDPEQLRTTATRAGFSGKQYSALSDILISRTKTDETAAYKMGSQAAGFGDVRPGRTKNNEHQFNKELKIFEYYDEAKKAAIADRGSFNPKETMLVAIERYNNNDRKDIQKNSAAASMKTLSDDIKKRKKREATFEITVDTNLDDLLSAKIINNDEYVALSKYQNILRKEVQ
jgi:hypothetical protein